MKLACITIHNFKNVSCELHLTLLTLIYQWQWFINNFLKGGRPASANSSWTLCQHWKVLVHITVPTYPDDCLLWRMCIPDQWNLPLTSLSWLCAKHVWAWATIVCVDWWPSTIPARMVNSINDGSNRKFHAFSLGHSWRHFMPFLTSKFPRQIIIDSICASVLQFDELGREPLLQVVDDQHCNILSILFSV